MTYALRNAPLVSLAGLISGFQEAYYKFEVCMHALRESMRACVTECTFS